MTASYSQFTRCDLDNDGRADLFVLRFDARRAVRQSCTGTGTIRCERATRRRPCRQVSSVKRIMTGAVAYNIPAVFVTSA